MLALRIFTPPPAAALVVPLPDDGQGLAGDDTKFVTSASSIRLRHVHAAFVGHAEALLHASKVGMAGLETWKPSGAKL